MFKSGNTSTHFRGPHFPASYVSWSRSVAYLALCELEHPPFCCSCQCANDSIHTVDVRLKPLRLYNLKRWKVERCQEGSDQKLMQTHPPDLTSWCLVKKTVVRIMGIFVGGISWKQQLLVLTQLRKEIEKECFINLTKSKRNKWNNLPETDKKSPC